MPQMIIPEYPDFCAFSFDYKDDYEQIYNQYEPYSEFSFANMVIWLNTFGGLEISKTNNNLVIRFNSPEKPNSIIYGVYGDNLIDDTFNKILTPRQLSSTNPTKIDIVPEFSLSKVVNKGLFEIMEDCDNWEYIYDTKELSELNTPEQSRNRRKVRRFSRENGSSCITEQVDLSNAEIRDSVYEFISKIASSDQNRKNDRANLEINAIENTLRYHDKLHIQNMVLRIDNHIEGFMAYHVAKNNYALVSHIKVNYVFNNIFDFFVNNLATKLSDASINYLNLEQDLGIQGLRTYKTRLRPIKMQKKYIISLKT